MFIVQVFPKSCVHQHYCQLNRATKSDRTDNGGGVDSGCGVGVATTKDFRRCSGRGGNRGSNKKK